jgi:TRAP-type C4-dicarboxylate transport system substrate-binding protein
MKALRNINKILKTVARCAAVTLVLAPLAAGAEPIKLKLSFFTSDRSQTYLHTTKPFVDAVNAEGKGLLEIEVFFSGALGRRQTQQPQLLLDGVADIAMIVPGQTPDRFQDTAVVELPGLFRNAREATLTYTRLNAAHALKGYEDFFVIGSFSADPDSIHSRKPIGSLADLKGQRLRTNNLREAAALEKLGAVPVLLSIIQSPDAISSGNIDGATLAPSALLDFGIARVTSNHYLLRISAAPLALLMNRNKFDSLPEQAKALIRKYSGEWTAARFVEDWEKLEKREVEKIRSDALRTVILPSPPDLVAAQRAFQSVVDEWAASSTRHRELLMLVEAELTKIRSTKP